MKSLSKMHARVLSACGVAAASVAGVASAAVPAGVEAAFTSMSTDFGTVIGYAYTAGAIVVGGGVLFGIVWKLLKRTGSKA